MTFLTEEKEREKLRKKKLKEQGIEIVVKKRLKHEEDHHDDCGEDLSGIGETTYLCRSESEADLSSTE